MIYLTQRILLRKLKPPYKRKGDFRNRFFNKVLKCNLRHDAPPSMPISPMQRSYEKNTES